ncbi:MAG: hypothetical protein AAGI44_15565 [Pseudomonadota bacterium]
MTDDNDDFFTAIALSLDTNSDRAVGSIPDDEDLAALADGRLDATRRSQVISHLVSDENLYARWVALQSAIHVQLEYVAEIHKSSTTAKSAEGFLATLTSWIALIARPRYAGGLAALMLAVIFSPALVPEYSQNMDALYDAAPGAQIESHRSVAGSRGLTELSATARSTTSQLVEGGLAAGERALGLEADSETGVSRYTVLSLYNKLGLIRPSWRARYELGRWLYLASIQCRVSSDEAVFASVLDQLQQIREALPRSGLSDQNSLNNIVDAYNLAGQANFRVCVAAERGLEYIGSPVP